MQTIITSHKLLTR